MKKVLLIFALATGGSLFGQSTTGLVSFYPFSGDASDAHGVDDFSIVGGPVLTEDRFGNMGCAYEFTGDTSDYLQILDPTFGVNYDNGWSVSLWYKTYSYEGWDYESIFRQGEKDDSDYPYGDVICTEIALYDLNKPLGFVSKNYGGWHQIWSGNDEFEDSTSWHHVVLSIDPLQQTLELYVDNVLAASKDSVDVFDYCESPIYVGRKFNGKVDDIFYYHRTLTATDVDDLFNAPGACPGDPLSTSVTDLMEGVNLYPNPTENILNVETEISIQSYQVLNSLGKVVLSAEDFDGTSIQMNGLPEGVYLVKFITKDHKVLTSIISKR